MLCCVLDAIVVLEDQLLNGELDSSTTSLDSEDSISLKIQSSKKTAVYSIAKVNHNNCSPAIYIIMIICRCSLITPSPPL